MQRGFPSALPGASEPVDLGHIKGKGGQATVRADVGPGRGTLAWEAGGHRELDSEEGPLSTPALSPRGS